MMLGICLGYKYKDLENVVLNGILNGLGVVLILLVVGVFVGMWIFGGIVLIIIYYGLKVIYFFIFLLVIMVICLLIVLVMGIFWGVVGIAGIVMMGIG